MGKNAVQFQKGMSLVAFQEQYGTEAQCRAALAAWRWPGGFQCDRCGHRGHACLATRPVWQCNRCKRQVSLTSGTLLAHTRLPLRVWFLVIFLLTQSKTGRSALALSRDLGIGYDAAWLLKHKLMQAMVEREGRRQLAGWVQLDDAYFGGERRGGPRGRGADGKQAFVAAVQCSEEGHPEVMRLDVVKGFSADEIGAWATRHLAPDTVVVSDALAGFNAVGEVAGTSHRRLRTGSGGHKCDHPALRWVNVMLGNVKTALRGTYHGPRRKYAQRYLGEFCYRFNRRFELHRLVARLTYVLLRTPPLPYRMATVDATAG